MLKRNTQYRLLPLKLHVRRWSRGRG